MSQVPEAFIHRLLWSLTEVFPPPAWIKSGSLPSLADI
jgi:hypothetical protein